MLAQCFMVKEVITASKEAIVKDVIDIMYKRHVGSVLIVDAENHLEGIFTERDAIRVVAQNVPLDVNIEKVMTRNVFTINPDSTFEEAKIILRFHKIRHLPIVDAENKLVGLLSVRHVLEEIAGI